jgi:hypothetical protein
MIKNKRGLSTIVITLILILLSLVAVGIVWVVVNNIIKSGAKGIDTSAKCLNVNVEATAVKCAGTNCNVTLMRTGTESEAITGVKLVFKNSTAGTSSAVIDEPGNIEVLAGKSINDVPAGIVPDKIEVTAYFEDDSGNEQLCGQTTSFEF